MPDFDTRRPQSPNEPNRSRILPISNRLSSLLSASKLRILSLASTLSRLLMANRRRTLVIGGGTVLFMVAAPLGLSIVQKINALQHEVEDAKLPPLAECPVGGDRNPSGPTGSPQKSSSTKKIVFVTGYTTSSSIAPDAFTMDSDGGFDIEMYMINTNSTSLTWLTEATAKKYGANRLPDGRKIEFFWSENGRKLEELRAGISSPITDGGRGLCSPDGKKAVVAESEWEAYASPPPGSPESDNLYVHTDHGRKKLKPGGSGDYTDESEPSFSPDSEKVAFLSDRDGEIRLYVANADGSHPTYLTKNEVWGSNPAWFPDSEKIAFVGDGDIYTIYADDTSLTQLTDNAPVGGNLVISPDGKQIAFVSSRTVHSQTVEGDLYIVNVDGTGLTRLTNTKAGEFIVTWV